jgi:Acetyltransferase (GNAT) domain
MAPMLATPSHDVAESRIDTLLPTAPHELPDWEPLLRQGTAGSIYLHPRLVQPGVQEYRGGRVFRLQDSDHGERGRPKALAILCPKAVVVRPLGRVFGTVKLKGYRLVGDQVVSADSETSLLPIVRAFTRLLIDREAECLLFEHIDVDSPLWKAIHALGEQERRRIAVLHPSPSQAHHRIDFPQPPTEYWKQFSGKTRSTLRRKANKFEHRVLKYTSPDNVPTFLAQAHEVSTKSWQTARLGLRIQNSPEERVYWGAIAAVGGFRSYVLEHQGAPVAFVLGTCWAGYYTYEELAYDQTYAAHSPGTILLYRLLEELIAADTPRVFDFGFGDAEYKQIFSNSQSRSGPVLLARRTFSPMIYVRAEQLSVRVSQLARACVRRLGVLKSLRRYRRRPLPTGG